MPAALQQASASSFDLVVSDLGLPDESGLELMKKLRMRHGLKGICLSGYGMEEEICAIRRGGVCDSPDQANQFRPPQSAIAAMARRPEQPSSRA